MKETKFKQTEIGLIPEDWGVKKLGWVAGFQYGLGESAKKEGDYVYLRITDISSDNTLNKLDLKYIKKEKVSPKYILKKGDVLVARTGATYGKTLFFHEDFKATYGGFLIKFIFDDKLIDNKFFSQFSRSKIYWHQANNLVNGGAQPQFNANTLSELIVPLPPLQEQRAIAKILTDIDSKIELLQKQNETLEKIGQTIFKHWFVDFEFPNEEGKPYKSSGGEMVYNEELGKEIPKGWEMSSLDQIANYLNGLALQKYPPKGEKNLPVIKIRELKQGITDTTNLANSDIPEEYVVKDGDILFSWSGSLKVVIWCNGKGALNQHLFKVTSDKYLKWFYYSWTLHHLKQFKRIAEDKATTMGHIKRKHLSEAKVLIPTKEKLEELNKIFNPLIEKQITLKVQTRTLQKTRDLLLPKLMTGKIRVPLK